MARDEEKARSMLNRYLRLKAEEAGEPVKGEKRPYLAVLCDDRDEAEKWRRQVLREINRAVFDIQNPGLDEGRLRDLNDRINKLLRQKYHWERRIRDLGGADHTRSSSLPAGAASVSRGGGGGPRYFYFGAARELPGVRELLEDARRQEEEDAARREEAAADLYRRVDAEYYGLDSAGKGLDGISESEERALAEAEATSRVRWIREWESQEENSKLGDVKEENAEDEGIVGIVGPLLEFVKVPTEEELEHVLLQRRKRELLDRMDEES